MGSAAIFTSSGLGSGNCARTSAGKPVANKTATLHTTLRATIQVHRGSEVQQVYRLPRHTFNRSRLESSPSVPCPSPLPGAPFRGPQQAAFASWGQRTCLQKWGDLVLLLVPLSVTPYSLFPGYSLVPLFPAFPFPAFPFPAFLSSPRPKNNSYLPHSIHAIFRRALHPNSRKSLQ